MTSAKDMPSQRPAETSAIASAVALLGARAFGLQDADLITALAICIGGVPALVTWVVNMRRAG